MKPKIIDQLRDRDVCSVSSTRAHAFTDIDLALYFLVRFAELWHCQGVGLYGRRQHGISVTGGGINSCIVKSPHTMLANGSSGNEPKLGVIGQNPQDLRVNHFAGILVVLASEPGASFAQICQARAGQTSFFYRLN